MAFAAALLLVLPTLTVAHESSYEHILWDVHPERMLFPVSDLTATYLEATNQIYLLGGCDNKDGNIRAEWDDFLFYCPSLTDRMTIFDVATGTFTQGPRMPTPRTRHATVHDGNGYLWLLGGRNVDDGLVSQIDIFDATGTGHWLDTEGLHIPEFYNTSDHAAFVDQEGTIFVAGGYDANYTARTDVFAIDARATLQTGTLQYGARQSLNQGRGDARAATIKEGDGKTYAYIVGGFTDEDEWCKPLHSTERYDFATDRWMDLDDLSTGRGDKALVALHDRIFAIGGEGNTDCSKDPAQKTWPINQVEVLDTHGGGHVAEWTLVEDIPNDRFRFAAAAVPSQNAMYTFGGQKYYNPSCDCFATSDLVIVYQDEVETYDDDDERMSAGAIVGITLASVAGAMALAFVMYKMVWPKKSMGHEQEGPVTNGGKAHPDHSTTEMDPDALDGYNSAPLS